MGSTQSTWGVVRQTEKRSVAARPATAVCARLFILFNSK